MKQICLYEKFGNFAENKDIAKNIRIKEIMPILEKDESQVNEILMKCICHNLAVLVQEGFELGLEIDLNSCAKYVLAQK